MTRSKTLVAAIAMAGFLSSTIAFAQTTPAPAPAAAAPAMNAMPKVDPAKKAAISKQCSADADKQGLHGKARKKFREDCKKKAMM